MEEPGVKNSYQYVFELREKLEDTLKLAHTELQKAQHKGKYYYDRKAKVRRFAQGDKVLVLLPTDHNKLLMQWKGPFEVSAVVGLNDYKVCVKGKERVYHAVAVEVNADISESGHAKMKQKKLILWMVLVFWKSVDMSLKSQSKMWLLEITLLMSKEQSL